MAERDIVRDNRARMHLAGLVHSLEYRRFRSGGETMGRAILNC
jgi:hypothetical protein